MVVWKEGENDVEGWMKPKVAPGRLMDSTVGGSVCRRRRPEALRRELADDCQGCGCLDCRAAIRARKGGKHGNFHV